MIWEAVESGDHSLLNPFTLRDLIWVQVCRSIKSEQEWNIEKSRIEFEAENEKRKYYLLCDLRSIMFGTLGYTKDEQAKSDDAWYNLPSMIAYNIKNEHAHVGISRGARKKMESDEKSGA